MLTCKEITENASRLVDGELSFSERLGIWLHVFMCKKCRRFIQQFDNLVSSMARRNELQSDVASTGFTERVMQNLPQQKGSASLSEENKSSPQKHNRRKRDHRNQPR